ncbi:hypothetical protein CEQ90_14220 [Lewinellaceae bacterium SD302]|nr:hypothetical protein CEQ90_14220 [Lewinellaceae bacterium SD302]
MQYHQIIQAIFLVSIANLGLNAQLLTSPDTIPFVLTEHNNLAVEAVLNQRDTLTLMLHTAAGDASLIREVTPDLASIEWARTDSSSSWGGRGTSRFSPCNHLEVGSVARDSLPLWENTNSGPGTAGKFGLNFFQTALVEINYSRREIVLHHHRPAELKQMDSLSFRSQGEMMFLPATSTIGEQNYPHEFLIHSGYRDGLLYDDDFAAKSGVNDQLEILEEQELRDAQNNVLITKKAKLPGLKIGHQTLSNVSVGFFSGAIGRQKMSVLGGEILRQFNWVFDLDNEVVYFEQLAAKG